jgi:hypothetical protein
LGIELEGEDKLSDNLQCCHGEFVGEGAHSKNKYFSGDGHFGVNV